MSAQVKPAARHEVLFTMGDESKAKVDALLRQCGHNNLNLLLARGLALVQWVEDQAEQGRTVAAVVYADQNERGRADQVFELVERADLLKPRQQALAAVPVAAVPPIAAEVAEAPATSPEAAPAPSAEPTTPVKASKAAPNPKLVARPKTPPAKKAAGRTPRGSRNRALEVLNAHRVSDESGPVKSYTWVRWRAEMDKKLPPIHVGDNRALPGELGPQHLEELERMSKDARHATHFKIGQWGELCYYGFEPGRGWCYLEDCSMRLLPDTYCDGGLFAVFPVVMAIEYLQKLANPLRASATA